MSLKMSLRRPALVCAHHHRPAKAWSKRREDASSTRSKLPVMSQHEGSER